MPTSFPSPQQSSNPDLYRYIGLLTQNPRASRLHFNLRYILAMLPEPDYRSGMPDEYPEELTDDIKILIRMLDIAAHGTPEKPVKEEEDTMDKLISFLVMCIRPEKIFLLPHPPGGNGPYTDLIIVVPDSSQRTFESIEQVVELGCIYQQYVNTTVLRSFDLNKKIIAGDFYYSTVCTPQRMVYDNGKVSLPPTMPEHMAAMKQKATGIFETGYRKAAGFLQAAIQQGNDPQPALPAFMLQQAAELTFRTTTLALTGFDPRTHSFEILKKHSRRCAPELNDFFPENTSAETNLLQLLESAYLNARYRDNYAITPQELQLLTRRVTRLHQRAKEIFDYQLQQLFQEGNTGFIP